MTHTPIVCLYIGGEWVESNAVPNGTWFTATRQHQIALTYTPQYIYLYFSSINCFYTGAFKLSYIILFIQVANHFIH